MITLKDITTTFTQKVNEYIAQGYRFSVSMSGHQGEKMKVDLENGECTVRVRLDTETNGEELLWTSAYVIVIEKYDIVPQSNWTTLWNGKGDLIEKLVYYPLQRDFDSTVFTDSKEEFLAIQELRENRAESRRSSKCKTFNNETAKKIALNYVRKQPRCKTKKMDYIIGVQKYDGEWRIITQGTNIRIKTA